MATYKVHNEIRKKATILGLITLYFWVFFIIAVISILVFVANPSFICFGGLGVGNGVLYIVFFYVQDLSPDEFKSTLPRIIINN